jgi:hypothetical protein
MSQFPPPDPDDSLDVTTDGIFAISEPLAVHLPGAGESPADERVVELVLQLRPGLLFVTGSVS